MNVEVKITKRDIVHFNLALIPRLKNIFTNFIVMSGIVFILLVWKRGFPDTSTDWVIHTLVSLIGGVFAFVFGVAFSILSILKNMKSYNGVLGVHQYRVDSEGFHEKTKVNQSMYSWDGIEKIIELKFYILYQVHEGLYHIIPKRSFESKKKCEEFLGFSKKQLENVPNPTI